MIVFLIIFTLILLVYVIYLNYFNYHNNLIEDLKWPFLNIIDENNHKVDIVCLRGPLEKQEDKNLFEKFRDEGKLIIGCSSYLSFPNKSNNPICDYNNFFYKDNRLDSIVDGWLHPFRDESALKSKNNILISESDFSDNILKLKNFDVKDKKINYDFICYCPSDEGSCDEGWNYYNKNWKLAKKTIEEACNTLNLKGILVGRENCPIDVEKDKLERHERLSYYDFIDKISQSKFMIVSSYEDASPRIISESLLVNTPVLVYKDIIGGWKYVNEKTGLFYDESDINLKINKILKDNFKPREYYLNNFGVEKSGKKFRDFIVKIDPSFSRYKSLRFAIS